MAERTQNILVIEDDPAVAEALVEGIGREGFDVHWESTGEGGIAHARDASPHLIVLDVRLPDGSGFDVCRELRRQGLHQPILMLTVQREEIDKVLGLEMGADDYMTKPYSLRELLARVRALLRRAYGELANANACVLYAGDLVIDLERSEAWRGDPLTGAGKQIVPLTPIEFKLLAYLARHPGQALSRAQIIEAVWGYAADDESERTVNEHVRRLREKIEIDPSHPALILTVAGIGYRLARTDG
jgi:DNA-binding response OmpR family regulator